MALFTAIGTTLGASAIAGTGLFGASAAATVGAGVVAAGAAGTMMMMNQGGDTGSQQQAQMPQAPEAPKMADASKLAKDSAMDRMRAASRSKSVMTNPLGVKDEAEVARKKLLGG